MKVRLMAPISLTLLMCGACRAATDPVAPEPEKAPGYRTYAMGFSPIAPAGEVATLRTVIDSMAAVSDIAIIQHHVPWPELFAGVPMDSLVEGQGRVADHLRAMGMDVIFVVDPLDAWDRRKEDPALLAAGRSLEEPSIRAMYEEWVRGIARRVHPKWFGLASEINTLAARGDRTLYATVRGLVNDLAPQVRELSPSSSVFVSFQADEANGRFGPEPVDNLTLIDDFDIDALGLSSYPVFFFNQPSDIPSDYFTRFAKATDLPLLFVEGGWSSADVPGSPGTPEQQVAFLDRYEELLDGIQAKVWVMLTFEDQADAPPDFAHMGIVDAGLRRKPAYAAWNRIFDRPPAR